MNKIKNSNKNEFHDNESVERVKIKFDTKYNCCLEKTTEFHCFDLKDKIMKIVIEVKKRNNTHDKYPTTMVGENKFIKAKEYYDKGYNILFCFEFTDGLYYYEYCDEKLEVKIGGRRDRDRPEFKNYIYIDVKKLKKF
jgi:hypothetical protein